MSTEILTINSLELASELAHQELVYSNEAQDIFNGLYDDYLNLITKCAVKSNAASKVLQLMDNNFSYQEALAQTINEDENLCKQQLEEELNKYI